MPTAIKRTLEDKEKIEQGSKKPKNHIGNFSSYQIETTTLENHALSWTDESHVVWQRAGAECIKDKNDKPPSNYGQSAKEYLLSKKITLIRRVMILFIHTFLSRDDGL